MIFISTNYYLLILTFTLVIILLIVPVIPSGISQITTSQKTIPVYEITTRGNLDKPAVDVPGFGYQNKYPLNNTEELYRNCPSEVAIIVHGWWINEDKAKERFDRVKMSLENNSYSIPIIGFSWGSDTEWSAAKAIAKWNGPKLADFIFNLANICKQQQQQEKNNETKIRLIGHSLGSRVILSSLDSLHKNSTWNNNNFTITSVHLMGAAVDNEEISKNPKDILNDRTNWNTLKSDYGEDIQSEVITFYNLFNPKDNAFEPNSINPFSPFQVYPSFEGDLALGQNGSQTFPNITLPSNYVQKDVQNEIPFNKDADKDELCDVGFFDVYNPETFVCTITEVGDNHGGYFGFRADTTRLQDDGAMNVVVEQWRNK
jgi:hypothetical protein